ncbi:vesicle amine transport protein [Danaus plexippus plexippus]|uniref:Vesicle amine transport protein n=1 Tax=Danaus plexippus plexippus TaxID=278856 RepID=A0A212FLV4_DANPL|nr:vesicle amine transport protein [Danaus plexippus plexippus]
MRAVVLTGFGGLKTVKILKKPEPTVGEGEVLIRVKAWFCIRLKFLHVLASIAGTRIGLAF